MSKTKIRLASPIKGLSKLELFKRVKQAINADSLSDTERFIKELEFKYEIEVESEIVPHLRNCFTFEIVGEKELEEIKRWEERRIKFQAANEWFQTLTPEQKEFVFILGRPFAS
jgi:hypothetical protein